ncbi:hypothetical protein NDU88_005324 [Pleurodeles waltl]|uniref:Uncharacterized protein n=1 Tax=Pleurodeles waltl TaxID=8319 RepID=A0AAV7UI91_PLEWA|nr:hypothetical protein NDU88_005324 [Pleurodeles waltl]
MVAISWPGLVKEKRNLLFPDVYDCRITVAYSGSWEVRGGKRGTQGPQAAPGPGWPASVWPWCTHSAAVIDTAALTPPLSVAYTATAMAATAADALVYGGALVSASAPSRSLCLLHLYPLREPALYFLLSAARVLPP